MLLTISITDVKLRCFFWTRLKIISFYITGLAIEAPETFEYTRAGSQIFTSIAKHFSLSRGSPNSSKARTTSTPRSSRVYAIAEDRARLFVIYIVKVNTRRYAASAGLTNGGRPSLRKFSIGEVSAVCRRYRACHPSPYGAIEASARRRLCDGLDFY